MREHIYVYNIYAHTTAHDDPSHTHAHTPSLHDDLPSYIQSSWHQKKAGETLQDTMFYIMSENVLGIEGTITDAASSPKPFQSWLSSCPHIYSSLSEEFPTT